MAYIFILAFVLKKYLSSYLVLSLLLFFFFLLQAPDNTWIYCADRLHSLKLPQHSSETMLHFLFLQTFFFFFYLG